MSISICAKFLQALKLPDSTHYLSGFFIFMSDYIEGLEYPETLIIKGDYILLYGFYCLHWPTISKCDALIERIQATKKMLIERGYNTDESILLLNENKSREYEEKSKLNYQEKTKISKVDDLYLIHDTVRHTLKIGRSKNPQARLSQLQNANSHQLLLLKVIKGKGHKEQGIHIKFNHLNIKNEWFKYDESIIFYFSSKAILQ